MSEATLDEICVVALAEAFRGDGELLCHPMGTLPVVAGRLARATFEPDLMLTDTVAYALTGTFAVGGVLDDPAECSRFGPGVAVEGYLPFRAVFDQAWSGVRHIVMGASQMDRYGNQNFASIGDYRKPKAQLLGLRGAPGNLVNHAASYWIPNQARTFSRTVDVVSGPGNDRMAALAEPLRRHHEIRRVVTNLGVYDFDTPEKSMRLASIHPGVSIDDVLKATPFDLVIPDEAPHSRLATEEELHLIREVIDPQGLRKAEFG